MFFRGQLTGQRDLQIGLGALCLIGSSHPLGRELAQLTRAAAIQFSLGLGGVPFTGHHRLQFGDLDRRGLQCVFELADHLTGDNAVT